MLAQKLSHTHYEAEMHSERRMTTVPQRCTRCRAEIPPGTFFTHRTLGATGATHLICALSAFPAGGSAPGRRTRRHPPVGRLIRRAIQIAPGRRAVEIAPAGE